MVSKIQTDANAPWKKRFLAPAIQGSKVARRAPERGIVITNRDGLAQIYAWNVVTGVLEKRTNRPDGLLSAYISPDGRFIYYLDEQTGNSMGHFMRIPYEGGEPEDVTPNLPYYGTGFASTYGLTFDSTGNRISFTAETEDGFRAYIIDCDPTGTFGAPQEVFYSAALTTAPILSSSGDIFVIGSAERSQSAQLSLLAFNADTGEKIGELWEGDSYSVTAFFFSPVSGDTRLAAVTDRGGDARLLIWNPVAGERFDLDLTGIEGELSALDWSVDGKKILFQSFNRTVQRLHIYHVEENSVYPLNHPSGRQSFRFFRSYFGPSGDIHSHLTTTTEPCQLVLLDGQNGSLKETLLETGKVPPGRPWSSFVFSSSDGQEIQGWLALPKGEGPFPLILHLIGGPHLVQSEGFSSSAQAWLDHGFAWASINYRGSSSFGKDFKEQILGNLGELEVEDVVAARHHLVTEGIADLEKIFLSGVSYGGFLTLLALGKYPDLWVGGMAEVALADWTMTYEDVSEGMKFFCAAIFGGTPEEKPEQYAKSSPTTYIQHVEAPILIIQGRNDTYSPPRPIEFYEEKMKALGKEIKVHWFDAGHTGADAQAELDMEFQEMTMQFAYDILEKLKH